MVEYCFLRKVQYNKSWLVQLDTSTKRKVREVVMECLIELNECLSKVNMNVLPLGSYDSLIGMDWLERHRVKVECYAKVLDCINEEGRSRIVKGITK